MDDVFPLPKGAGIFFGITFRKYRYLCAKKLEKRMIGGTVAITVPFFFWGGR